MAVFCVDSDAVSIKAAMVDIEETHDFGRLFDLDVTDLTGVNLDRKSLNQKPRKCYLCNEDAYVCARSKAHQTDELIDFLILKAQMLLDK
jgi:holo-ACP synthase